MQTFCGLVNVSYQIFFFKTEISGIVVPVETSVKGKMKNVTECLNAVYKSAVEEYGDEKCHDCLKSTKKCCRRKVHRMSKYWRQQVIQKFTFTS